MADHRKDNNSNPQSVPTINDANTTIKSTSATDAETEDQVIEEAFNHQTAPESSQNPTINSSEKPHQDTQKDSKKPRTTAQKIFFAFIILLFLGLIIAITIIIYFAFQNPDWNHKIDRVEYPEPLYSTLTGQEISDPALNSSSTYCVQIPNGPDGARPQAGLNQAAVVFEAIAESGITRFAAIFQNPTTSAIGPIRSLRPYYLDWDLPFDCTVVHAGGSDEAKSALAETKARNLDENPTYMWREYGSGRGWNNLFTSSSQLAEFNADHDYQTSNFQPFSRLIPDEVTAIQDAKIICDENENCSHNYLVPNFSISFGANPFFNTTYTYNPDSNTYNRFYSNGEPHLTYNCPADLTEPITTSACGDPIQVTPSVVIAMFVQERLMADQYHEDITTIGSGNAIVFQNGDATPATWTKTSAHSQILFSDLSGHELKFTPGQLWISAVPERYGNVTY